MIDAVPDLLAQRAGLTPGRTALIDHATGEAMSFADLDARAARVAGLLSSLGLVAGERVGLFARNSVAFFELMFGCAKAGLVFVPLNWRMPLAELVQLAQDCGPKLIAYGAADTEHGQALAERLGAIPLDLSEPGPGGYAARRDQAPPLARSLWPAEGIWYLLYTSGTTGWPKGVMYTYRMAVANILNVTQAIELTSADRTLNFLPMFHTAGINLHALPTLLAGGSVRVLNGFDLNAVVGLLDLGQIDTFFAVPAVYQDLSLHPQFDRLDLSGVRHWGCGGAPLPDALAQRYFARGIPVCNGMGMTETGPTVFLVDAAHAAGKIGSVGKPQLLSGVRLVRADGQDAAVGEEGEIWFAGPNVTPGYWNQPATTAAAFAPGGWLRSGDVGRKDADGYMYVVGRLKEMFISGGENVFPAEVENALCAHPAVLEAAVIGVPDPKWGEVGQAYVLTRPGLPPPDAGELIGFLRTRLAAYKVPRQIVLVSDFPRTAAGKVRKNLLGTEAAA